MKLDYKKTLYIGLAFLIISMFWQVYDNIIAKMLINSFGFNQTISGFILALDNIVALALLPLFGALSDKTKHKKGRRTPYIFYGVILSSILFIGVAVMDSYQIQAVQDAGVPHVEEMINVDDEVYGYKVGDNEYYFRGLEGEEEKTLYNYKQDALNDYQGQARAVSKANPMYLVGFLAVLFLVLLAMATYRTPAVSLMPDVTPKPLRSKANAIINLLGTLGGLISLGFMTFTAKDYQDYILTFIILAALMLTFLTVFMLKVKEVKLVEEFEKDNFDDLQVERALPNEKMPKDVRKSFILILASVLFWFMAYNAATSKFSVYSGNVLNTMFTTPLMVAQAVAALSFIPIGMISHKVGRKKTILVGIVILASAFLIGSFLTEASRGLIYITMGMAGMGWATINVNSYPMIVEMSKTSNVGRYTGFYYTASMAAQIITPVLSGLVMDGFFIDSIGVDMRRLFPYSVVFCTLAFITMSMVKHGDSKPIVKSKLEAFADEEQ
ncbi:MAG: MFS transporter [Bacilli bacterium]